MDHERQMQQLQSQMAELCKEFTEHVKELGNMSQLIQQLDLDELYKFKEHAALFEPLKRPKRRI